MGKKTIGPYRDFSLEAVQKKYIALIPSLASLFSGLSFLISFLFHDVYVTAVCALVTLVYGLAYLMVRRGGRLKLIIWMVTLSTLLFFNVLWFRFEGSEGSGLMLLLILFVIISILFTKAERIFALSIVIVNLIVLILIELKLPHLISPYMSELHRILDLFVTFCFCCVFVAIVTRGIISSYYQQKTKAEMADRLKSSFLQNISHEIRTPLNAIMGFSSVLTQEGVGSRDRHLYTEYIHSACRSLMKTIDEVIDLASIESNQYEVQTKECHVNGLLKQVYQHFMEQSSRRIRDGVEFGIHTDPDVFPGQDMEDVTVRTDPALLKQVLIFLVDNAVKYTFEGSIEFGCRKREGEVVFHVRDTGTGIPEKEYHTLFQSFRKIQEPDSKITRGLGLGLAISKKMVNLLGGRIWFESRTGKGSTFLFSIPDEMEDGPRNQVLQP